MYQYKNKRTGSIIRTHGKLTGGDWELQGTPKQTQETNAKAETTSAPAAEPPAAKTTTKKTAATGTKPAAKGKAK